MKKFFLQGIINIAFCCIFTLSAYTIEGQTLLSLALLLFATILSILSLFFLEVWISNIFTLIDLMKCAKIHYDKLLVLAHALPNKNHFEIIIAKPTKNTYIEYYLEEFIVRNIQVIQEYHFLKLQIHTDYTLYSMDFSSRIRDLSIPIYTHYQIDNDNLFSSKKGIFTYYHTKKLINVLVKNILQHHIRPSISRHDIIKQLALLEYSMKFPRISVTQAFEEFPQYFKDNHKKILMHLNRLTQGKINKISKYSIGHPVRNNF